MARGSNGFMRARLAVIITVCAFLVPPIFAQTTPAPSDRMNESAEPVIKDQAVEVWAWLGSGKRSGDQPQVQPDPQSAAPLEGILRDMPYAMLRLVDSFTVPGQEAAFDRQLPGDMLFQFKRSHATGDALTAMVRVQVSDPESGQKKMDAIRSTIRLAPGEGVLLRGIPQGTDELVLLLRRAPAAEKEPQNGKNQDENSSSEQQRPQDEGEQGQQDKNSEKKQQDTQHSNENQSSEDNPDHADTAESPENKDQEQQPSENTQDREISADQKDDRSSEEEQSSQASMETLKRLLDALEEADQQERKEQLRQLRNRVEVQGDWW